MSSNNISVRSDEEAHQWESFLESFRDCRVLRLIDFSTNDLSSHRALEILARVYFKHPAVDPSEFNNITIEPDDDGEVDTNELSRHSLDTQTSFPEYDLSKPMILKRRCGLRAVPYLILNDCSMTEPGALHLSYIISQHYYPQHLLSQVEPAPVARALDELDHHSHCWGLVYVPNETLTDNGARLLSLAEDKRKELSDSFTTPDDASEGPKDWLLVDAKQMTPVQRYISFR